MSSILNYIGKKNIDLEKYKISSYDTYIEPFGGSFNTGFHLLEQGYKGKVVYNDLDEQLINFWNTLKNNPSQLYLRCLTLYSQVTEAITEEEKQNILKYWINSKDKIKQAASKYVKLLFNTMKGMNYNKRIPPFAQYDFIIASGLINQDNVIIENLDFKDCIQKYDSQGTFLLIDPPYKRYSGEYYDLDYNQLDCNRLLETIDNIEGQWLFTYSDIYEIRKHFKDKNIEEYSRNMYGRRYVELYISKN